MKVKNSILSLVVSYALIALSTQFAIAQCGCTHIIALNSPYIIDGNTYRSIAGTVGIKPGDKVCFASGSRGAILFQNFKGTAAQPITVTNMCDGKVTITGQPGRLFYVGASSFIRVTGSANPNVKYGIEISNGTQALDFRDLSTDVEADHLYCHDLGYSALNAKTDPTCNSNTWRGNFTLRNVSFHDNYIKNTLGEGIYIGESHYNTTVPVTCNGVTIQAQEHDVIGVKVYNNIFENIGRDAIQVGSALSDCSIHHNTINGFGTTNEYGQQSGIQINPGTNTECYNNIVDTGTGFGIFAGGRGGSHFYNNIVMNCLQGAIICQDYIPVDPSGFVFSNNTFINNKDYCVYMYSQNTSQNLFVNNIIVAPNQANYEYVHFNNPAQIKWTDTNNIKTKVISDVNFVDPAAKDFRLKPEALLAIDRGRNMQSYGITFDHADSVRPIGANWDIGAHEYKPNLPVSNAGPDMSVVLPTNSLSLNGSGTSPTGVTGYLWTLKSGGVATLANETTATLSLSNLVEGIYVFQLEVKDVNGSAFDDVTVTVFPVGFNQAPTANAGNDITITLPTNSTTLVGSGSDPDGTISSYLWAQISGTAATFTGETTPSLSLSLLVAGTYEFSLTVTDNQGSTSSNNVIVTVNPVATNQPPVTNAGTAKTIYLPTSQVIITATASDPNGTIATILWEKRSGGAATLTNVNTLTLTASGLALGSYVFRITVTDNQGATAFSEVTVQVLQANQSPTANAGNNVAITLPTNTVVLTGSGTDPDGTIAGYSWVKLSGPAATLTNALTSVLTANGMVQGTYIFELTVTDNSGATGKDQVSVIVNAVPVNQLPLVSAGVDRTISLPTNSLTAVGTASDPNGTVASVLWTQKSGPIATLSNQNTLSLTLQNLVAGTYTFSLRATDNAGASSTDDMNVVVLPAGTNQSPLANAGLNKFITLPTNSVTITGVASDPDGTISATNWAKVSGPTATLSGAATTSLAVSNMVAGVYIFSFDVTDNSGNTTQDQVTVTVSASNLAPSVNAGADKFIILPTSSVQITAIASDPDGTIQTTQWVQLSGPAITLQDETTLTLQVLNITTAGTYVFEVTVTDNTSASKSDLITVNVLTATSNQLPSVSAGDDKTIQLPTSTVVLNGVASDPDGSISSLLWTLESGPAALLSNQTTSTLTALNMLQGAYVFRLTVTDNDGGISYAEATVTVLSSTTNQKPLANAGGDKTLQLPTNSITLAGSGADADGTIASYNWVKVSGPTLTINNPSNSSIQLTGLTQGIYVIRLTVTDNLGDTGSDLATITVLPLTVNQNPTVNAGSNQILSLPVTSTNLVGTGFDADGTISTYLWSKISGPAGESILSGANQVTQVTGLSIGTYIFRLTATDNSGATGFDEVTITLNDGTGNKPPIADAGGNQTITLPTTSLNLSGIGIDLDGSIVTYAWTKISGGTVVLTNVNNPTLTISNLQAGQYLFRLTVTDNVGAANFDQATITVNSQTVNTPPTVFAGGDKIVKSNQNSLVLSGSASDVDGSISQYKWELISGAAVTLGAANGPSLTVSALAVGTYIFRLTATDNASASSFDQMTLTVIPSTSNLAPLVNAGNDLSLFLPASTATTSASATDDGTIASYLWVQTSGSTATLTNQNQLNLSISGLAVGTYTFQLTAVDNSGASAFDAINITVFPLTTNQSPVVNAGINQQITFPTNTIVLTGTALDNDGVVSLLKWTKVSGGAATLVNDNTLDLTLQNLIPGTYVFQLTATDNLGASTSSTVQLIVNPVPPNKPPVVDAGLNQVIVSPVSSVVQTGQATDTDGTVSGVVWKQIQGPNTATLSNTSTLTLTADNLIIGTYIFSLSATDDSGNIGHDDVIVIVSSAASTGNQPPVVYAGTDVVVVLPDNTATIIGEGIDPDGIINIFLWEQVSGPPATFTTTQQVLSLTDLVLGEYTFRLTATDDQFTTAFDDVNVSVIDKADEIPQFFSPNNDGIGETWVFRNIQSYQTCSVLVFTRSGQKVFSAKPYQNDWNGTLNGQALGDGDYYYVVSCDDGRKIKGALRIIR